MLLKKFLTVAFLSLFPMSSFAKIDRFHQVSGGLYRGAQPTEVSDYEMLRNLGVKTIVNLREEGANEIAVAKKFGLQLKLFPMNAFTYPDDDQVNKILTVLSDPENQPVFIHCEFGKDRTGLIVALYRFFQEKWSAKQAYNEMVKLGFNRIFINLRHYYQKKTKSLPSFLRRMPTLELAPAEFDN
jgi:tyrosine-protein phosphatase SIW14